MRLRAKINSDGTRNGTTVKIVDADTGEEVSLPGLVWGVTWSIPPGDGNQPTATVIYRARMDEVEIAAEADIELADRPT